MRSAVILSLLVLVLFLQPATCRALNEWTIIVYLCSDDNDSATLENANIRDIIEMDSVGSGSGYEILVQADRGTKLSSLMKQTYSDPNYSGAMRYCIQRDKWITEGKLGEVNSGSPYTLWECLKWAAKDHPAKRYMLVLGGHGSGVFSWRGTGNVNASNPGAVSFDPDRFVAYDDTDKDCLTIFEVRAVLEAFRQKLNRGRKVDIVAFDACLSGMIEVLYELKESAGVLIFSAATVPMTGLAFDDIARAVRNNPKIDAEELAKVTVKSFIDDAPCAGDGDVMGAWRCSKAEDLASAWSNLSIELLRAMKETGKGFGVQNLTNYNDRYWDLKRICKSIADGDCKLNGASNRDRIQELAGDVLAERSDACISLWYGGSYSKNKVGGLSVAWPEKDEYRKWRDFYKALAFSREGKWDEVLDRRELGIK